MRSTCSLVRFEHLVTCIPDMRTFPQPLAIVERMRTWREINSLWWASSAPVFLPDMCTFPLPSSTLDLQTLRSDAPGLRSTFDSQTLGQDARGLRSTCSGALGAPLSSFLKLPSSTLDLQTLVSDATMEQD